MGRSARCVAGLVTAAMVLGACASDRDGSGASAENTSPPSVSDASSVVAQCGETNPSEGTVTLWHALSGSVTLDALDELAAQMLDDTGTRLEYRRFDGEADLLANLATATKADQPDLVLVTDQATRALLDSERFVHPDECDVQIVDDVVPQVASTYSFQGRLAALPFGVSTQVLVFDAARFRAAGLDPTNPPTTFDSLLDASSTIVASGASDYGLVATDSCAAILIPQFSAQRGVTLGSDDNGHADRMQSVELSSPETIADLSALRDATWAEHVKYLGPNPSGFDDLVNITMPSDGGVMALHTSAAVGEIIALLDNGNFKSLELGVAPLPGPGSGALIGGNALWLRNNTDARQLGRAWRAMEWLYAPAHLAMFDAATGYSPPTLSLIHI